MPKARCARCRRSRRGRAGSRPGPAAAREAGRGARSEARERRERQRARRPTKKAFMARDGIAEGHDAARRELPERRVDGRVVLVVDPFPEASRSAIQRRRLGPVAPRVGIAAVELDPALPDVAVDVVESSGGAATERRTPERARRRARAEARRGDPARRREARPGTRRKRAPNHARRCAANRARLVAARGPGQDAGRQRPARWRTRAGLHAARLTAWRRMVPRILAPARSVPRASRSPCCGRGGADSRPAPRRTRRPRARGLHLHLDGPAEVAIAHAEAPERRSAVIARNGPRSVARVPISRFMSRRRAAFRGPRARDGRPGARRPRLARADHEVGVARQDRREHVASWAG